MQNEIETRKPEKRKVAIALLALLLAIAVAITVSAAYYITTGGPSENEGRVAKWGVTITDKTGAGFQKEYSNGTGQYVYSQNQAYNVLAPGTSGSLLACTIEGQPEVKFKVSFDTATENESPIQILGNWDITTAKGTDGTEIGTDTTGNTDAYNDDFYCPVIFTFTWYDAASASIKSETVDGTDGFDDAEALETALATELKKVTTTYNAGVDLGTLKDANSTPDPGINSFPTITWEWKFGTSDNASGSVASNQTNNRDTALGNLAATIYPTSSGAYASGSTDTTGMPTIKSNIKCTIQQVES
jgi:hypothetical protein